MKYNLIKPLLFGLEPEKAHNLAIFALANNLVCHPQIKDYSSLKNEIFGINFSNPIGLAAGFDKNAKVFDKLFNFGFGFVECGTVTPKPQSGNPHPRLFRLPEDQAIINRLGFNNGGIEKFLQNVSSKKIQNENILGINIGKNKDTENALDDYLILLEKVYVLSNYITINISSPNTKNLRDLQKADNLDEFLAAIMRKKLELVQTKNRSIPILLKIAPDLDNKEQESIAEISLKNKIDGLIISNTTINGKEKLHSIYKNQTGGLSGKPLFTASNAVLKNIYKLTKGEIPIIGVGGVSSAVEAYEKIKYGASLIQIYSAFIYQGFELVEKIKQDLDDLLRRDGFANIKQAIGQVVEKNN
jgi:dihydroorotate dehydrogenase